MKMTGNDLELLGRFVRDQSQDAFTELVNRHLNLVYTAALRQVRSPELAQEVAQTAFTELARQSSRLKADTILTAWLYQVTRNTAIDVVRREARRQAREQLAVQMSETNDTSASWAEIEPMLDEAMHSLESADRTAILLRYFENKSLREIGEALGTSEDAAQKRVSRAVERLREFFCHHRIAVGAGGLAALISTNAVQAAPAGLAGTIIASSITVSALSTSTVITVTKAIAMTTLQKSIVTVAIAGAIAVGVYEARQASKFRQEAKALQEQQIASSNQIQALERERDRATNRAAALSSEVSSLKKNPNEVLKLRGEVGKLRQENSNLGSSSALSKVTANPEAKKLLRDQQKLGMGIIYKQFAQQLNLNGDQTEKLNNLLADHIMENVNNVTTMLRDKTSVDQMRKIFTAQEATLQEQLQEVLGQDKMDQYRDYTHNLLSSLTAEQFKSMMSGSDDEKKQKSSQIYQAMVEEVKAALERAGLPADHQMLPILDFVNIASEGEGEKSLNLLDEVYAHVADRSGAFLPADDQKKFREFRTTAINNNRSALSLNRVMMAPIAQ